LNYIKLVDILGTSFSIDEKFDIVSAFDVLFHIVDDQLYGNAWKNISNKVKKAGYFIFTENLFLAPKISTHIVFREREKLFEKLVHNLKIGKIAPVFVLMNELIVTQSVLLKLWWKGVQTLLKFSSVSGNILGPKLFLIEGLLINIVSNGPSTHIIICKKM
jgi:hypothetical protein